LLSAGAPAPSIENGIPASRVMATERLSVFPAFHKVSGRVVAVVGDGPAAAAKVRLLLETEAAIRLVAEAPVGELIELIGRGGIEHVARPFLPEDLEGAVLVFTATGERARDAEVVAAARAAGVPANAVDSPELCDFLTPALVNRAPVAVAIGSAGAGPVLTQKLRARIEALLPMRLGALARLAECFRGAAERLLPKGAPRRAFWSAFFEGAVAAAALGGRPEEARRLAFRLLSGAGGGERGFVWIVGAGPGATDLLTLRAHRLLLEADVVVHDALVPESVVAMGRRDAERIAVGKRKAKAAVAQDDINAILIREASRGRRVVRLKAGDPLVFGRAGEEMAALRAAGVPFEVVPGVTAAFAAAAEAEIPLTLRGVSSSLIFATGHSASREGADWTALARAGATVAVYMGRSAAGEIAAGLIAAGLDAKTPVAVIESASRADARRFAGTLGDLRAYAGAADDAPALILIGRATAQGALSLAAPLAPARVLAA
jgi:uroporphyrin-III C-methyltransferase/precorrin-2 dehydrogenase/sirohydrochlorin ferrochelatase